MRIKVERIASIGGYFAITILTFLIYTFVRQMVVVAVRASGYAIVLSCSLILLIIINKNSRTTQGGSCNEK